MSRLVDSLTTLVVKSPCLSDDFLTLIVAYIKRCFASDQTNFVSINDIRLTRDNVRKSIKYLREIYRHRISKTRMISLNGSDGGRPGLTLSGEE